MILYFVELMPFSSYLYEMTKVGNGHKPKY